VTKASARRGTQERLLLVHRAAVKAAEFAAARREPRYLNSVGALVELGLLLAPGVAPCRAWPLDVGELLWVGEVEPRILELLPSLAVEHPELLVGMENAPADLLGAIDALRRGDCMEGFRGVPWRSVLQHRSRCAAVHISSVVTTPPQAKASA
jgi:hypothetical protein